MIARVDERWARPSGGVVAEVPCRARSQRCQTLIPERLSPEKFQFLCLKAFQRLSPEMLQRLSPEMLQRLSPKGFQTLSLESRRQYLALTVSYVPSPVLTSSPPPEGVVAQVPCLARSPHLQRSTAALRRIPVFFTLAHSIHWEAKASKIFTGTPRPVSSPDRFICAKSRVDE